MDRKELMKLLQTEFMPEIRKEIRKELQPSMNDFDSLRKKVQEVEESQKFISTKYDTILTLVQNVKKDANSNESHLSELEADLEKTKELINSFTSTLLLMLEERQFM